MPAADDQTNYGPIADVDPVIHAPARLAIMTALFVVERADFVFLQKQTGLTRGNLSSHIGKLEAAGYLAVEKTFVKRVPRTLLKVTPQGRTAFENYRRQMQHLFSGLPKK